jgi:general secretion pathway protein I
MKSKRAEIAPRPVQGGEDRRARCCRFPGSKRYPAFIPQRGFTLIEVMVALAVIAIALVGLLGLQHQTMQSVVRASEITKAALLAQELMTQTETGPFPQIGVTSGNFANLNPGLYPHFRWERSVEASAVFPDIRKVRVRVLYGPRFGRTFDLVEMIRNPLAALQQQN